MRRLALILVLLLCWTAPALARPEYARAIPGDSSIIYRLAWVEPGRLLRSGAVVVNGDHLAGDTEQDRAAVLRVYRALVAKYQVGAVVNLRDECGEDAAAARELGLSFLRLPIPDGQAPSADQVVRFFRFLDGELRARRVVLWHCAGGIGRTGVFNGMLRLLRGWSTKDAAAEMFQMGLNYDQAQAHLPALNAFAAELDRPGYYPPDWRGPKQAPVDYRGLASRLPRLP